MALFQGLPIFASQATTAQGGLGANVQAARSSWQRSFARPFSSSAILSDKSDSSRNIPHPEFPGSDLPPSSDKLQKDRGGYGLAKPPQTEDLIPSRGSPEAPLQESHLNETDSQEQAPSIPQHQMPGVPGDLIPPGVAPQLPQRPDDDPPPGVDPSILTPQEQQSGSTQVTENVDSQASGYWAGRVPGTPISNSDEQQKS
ncbi:TPA: hypothetical protein ACH3X3_003915 [Trebouxia sp. C0006]